MKTEPLGEVCKIVNGGTPKSGVDAYWDGGVAWLTPAQMGKMSGRHIAETDRTITEAGLNNSSAKLIPPSSVILSTRAPIGHLAINDVPMAFNQGCRGLVPGDRLDTSYLYYFLRHSRVALDALGSGTTFKELSASRLREFPIPMPPVDEQRQLVAALDKAFAAIATVTANVEVNLSNSQVLLDQVVDQALSRSGGGWRCTTLESVCERFEYGTSQKSKPSGRVPVLRMGNLQAGEIDWSDLVYTDNEYDAARLMLRDGDVLFNRTNSLEHVGKAALVRGDTNAIFAGYLVRVHCDPQFLLPKYLLIYLNSRRTRDHGRRVAGKSVNQANISAGKLREYPINLPPIAEQKVIAERIEQMTQNVRNLQRTYRERLGCLNLLEQALLQSAFSGASLGPDRLAA